MLETDFLETLLENYNMAETNAYIADSNSRILVCTQNERIGTTGNTAKYISMIGRSATIQSGSIENEGKLHHGIPVLKDGSLEYVVVTYGKPEIIEKAGAMIQVALQTALEYSEYENKKRVTPKEKYDVIAKMMLSEKSDKNRILPLMHSNELEPDLMRSVIYINLEYNQNTYFNINLNLGYEAAIEELRLEIAQRIRKSKFINKQDIVYIPDRNTIIVIKSFINTEDVSRMYAALEAVCKSLGDILDGYSAVTFSMSYGNFYKGVDDIYLSWKEAYEMLKLGRNSGEHSFYKLDNLLFEYMGKHMEAQVENKFIVPAIKKLTDSNGNIMAQLIENAETYVDCCMSLSLSSDKLGIHRNTICSRLRRFEEITGLNPEGSFRDAFLVKMLAVYMRSGDKHIIDENRG